MDREWFEMRTQRKRVLDRAVWIPLRSSKTILSSGRFGHPGHVEEFFGAGSLAVPLEARADAENLGWMDIGISTNHRPYVDDDGYLAADTFESAAGFKGIHLVLDQHLNGEDGVRWLLHQDLVLGLDLLREGDTWLRPEEGYLKVAELKRDAEGNPAEFLFRAEHLKDFLAAREMALLVSSYHSRRWISENVDHLPWDEDGGATEEDDRSKWEVRVSRIHEGGLLPYGERISVYHVGHSGFDDDEDVPVLPHPAEGEFDSKSWELERGTPALHFVQGEYWKTEWIEPGERGLRLRRERGPSTSVFIVDAAGDQRSGDDLAKEGRWLWFRPDIVPTLAHRRGGHLRWYTRHTGAVSGGPGSGVHFGINRLGLVTVYAKDIGYLPPWQQKIWAGYNVGPEGGVSQELLAAQVRAEPASTQAPEEFLERGLELLATCSKERFGHSIVGEHERLPDILGRTHRFRAIDEAGLFSLAKDLARVTADLIDAAWLNQHLGRSGDQRLGSLKATEALLSEVVGEEKAYSLMGPLFGIYELRLGDAHLPGSTLYDALALVNVDPESPGVHQGLQLLDACVSTIFNVVEVLRPRDDSTGAS